MNHSSAVLNDYLYVFCGQKSNQLMLDNNIEKLHIDSNGLMSRWEVVNVAVATYYSDNLIGRCNPLVAAITPTEIAILGGNIIGSKLGDGYIFNVESGTMRKAFESNFKFDT